MNNAFPATDIARAVEKSNVSIAAPKAGSSIYLVGARGETGTYSVDLTRRQRHAIYYEMYRQHPTVRAAIEKIAKTSVRNGYRFVPAVPGDTVSKTKKNVLRRFFRKSQANKLLGLTYKDLLIYGESFWLVVGARAKRPSHAMRLHANAMDPDVTNGVLTGWRYGPMVKGLANEIKYNVDEVIHFQLDDPEDDLKGLSPLDSLQHTVASDLFAMKYNTKFFENAASSGLIFVMKNSSNEEVLRNREYLEQNYAGTDNAHRPMVLEGDIDVKKAGSTRQEMQFIELRKFNRQEILSLLDIDPSKLGINESANRSISHEADNSFRSETIGSLQTVVEDEISNSIIMDLLGWDDVLFEQEESSLRDKLEAAKLFVQFQDAGVFSVNDILGEIGYPALSAAEGGDIHFISAATGAIPLDLIRTVAESTGSPSTPTQPADNTPTDPNTADNPLADNPPPSNQ